jgi:hypothetical protein
LPAESVNKQRPDSCPAVALPFGIQVRLSESEQRGLDDPVKEGPLLQGVEVAVRAFMGGTVAPGMFF